MKRTKAEWRRALLTARSAIPEIRRRELSVSMSEYVRRLPSFDQASSVLGYAALGAEADPLHLLQSRIKMGGAVFLPSSEGPADDPRWVEWNGLLMGDQSQALLARSLIYPVFAILPGVGFDVRGVRLGRGGGFYDRALADLRRSGAVLAIGLAFECQIVPELPCDPWDQRVDFVASEHRLLETRAEVQSRREAGGQWS